MTCEVAITGYGVFTAFGFGAEALRAGVFAGRPDFRPVTRFDSAPYFAKYAAEYTGDGPEIPGVPVRPGYTPGQSEVLLACAKVALEMAGSDGAGAAVLLGTNGDHSTGRHFWEDVQGGRTPGTSRTLDSLASMIPHRLAEELGLGAPRLAFVNACVAATNTIAHAAQLIRTGAATTVVCGGASMVTEDVFARFDSGKALTQEDRVRPFSRDRSGLLQGDGAAVLVLESAAAARARGADVLAKVSGWSMTADAHHAIQPHPQGAGLAAAARTALLRAEVTPEQVGYVNAHGTGTELNDVAETAALHAVFGPHAPSIPVSSTKSTTGHMLEATGAVEAVITLLALQDGLLPPTMGLDEPDPECDLDYIPGAARPARIMHALSLNAAFGGVNAALVLERAHSSDDQKESV
ncbi:beta-ketoacyl-[acyl-carrier-protein] synthase family protein (plasmid) [Streptomyces sp. NBC_01340]|uniref:beta-ketoacyl-[acyl-carrier-protein] synthase family protein n=1 Tax=unclassified Streptomyces TaxID=2593676 RepID=UPI0022585C9C|nr:MULTISPECIES: beta-ketoacyl-[acyl-carrier-protein] synthase family protein [unclassified Streptomyces]MCX4458623.1 beta-ketoacyl-[acyl-carrier-protein] synthase family protein [Streptomyces sp. NBC_01719]MCX4460468.1 beta-ketoacyl-[acyl-carrier-protein] synthase family protein [Streptomyces sp. NBC_01719]MCX4497980.1 beta-ketoacyl-[acyl-carrier-protein] synthase family protein [Streptomyces sp. NBC_01728]MCX4500202.1 beta-ketoacyl-[acyl-carrier-protein] synthase family protein [Streptomyces 